VFFGVFGEKKVSSSEKGGGFSQGRRTWPYRDSTNLYARRAEGAMTTMVTMASEREGFLQMNSGGEGCDDN